MGSAASGELADKVGPKPALTPLSLGTQDKFGHSWSAEGERRLPVLLGAKAWEVSFAQDLLGDLLEVKLTEVWDPLQISPPGVFNSQTCPHRAEKPLVFVNCSWFSHPVLAPMEVSAPLS